MKLFQMKWLGRRTRWSEVALFFILLWMHTKWHENIFATKTHERARKIFDVYFQSCPEFNRGCQ